MRAFVLKAGKERVMIKELANEHKRASTVFDTPIDAAGATGGNA
jgi:hypothetical protein